MQKSRLKKRKCKHCKMVFQQTYSPLQFLCSTKCNREYKQKNDVKALKENMMGRSEYLGILQMVFNAYIRKRDERLPCISCGSNYTYDNKLTAGHYFPVGSYPNLRFNEDNVFGQCTRCNLHKHGNLAEYIVGLPQRIGNERVAQLYLDRDLPLKLTLNEILFKIKFYKQKTKELVNA